MKKFITLFVVLLVISCKSFAAGGDNDYQEEDKFVAKPWGYSKVLKLIKNDQYQEAIQKLEKILKKKKYTKDPDILNHYAFALRKTKNFIKAEEYYKKALAIEPDHKGALEYIGELYVDTNRLELAKSTLQKLEKCKCEEYDELKNYINN